MPQALAQRTDHAGPQGAREEFPPEASILMVLLDLRWPLSYSAGSCQAKLSPDQQRLVVMILQVSVIGIIAVG